MAPPAEMGQLVSLEPKAARAHESSTRRGRVMSVKRISIVVVSMLVVAGASNQALTEEIQVLTAGNFKANFDGYTT